MKLKYRKFEGAEFIGEAISMISHHDLDVALIKSILPIEDCNSIERNFFESKNRQRRSDNVPGYMLGATHYGQSPIDYFNQCSDSRVALEGIFENTSDPMRSVHEAIAKETKGSIRPSCFRSQRALHARAVEWLPDASVQSDFLLLPHEDFSQIDCARNDGWEIRDAQNIMAINFYASADAGTGRLRVYDYIPDAETRNSLELQGIGYPYPLSMLHDKSYVELAVETGDLAVINGKYIHAVTTTSNKRVVINCFVSRMPNFEYVFWT
jgi:hypothetical protein